MMVRARRRHDPVLDQVIGNADAATMISVCQIGDSLFEVCCVAPSGGRLQARGLNRTAFEFQEDMQRQFTGVYYWFKGIVQDDGWTRMLRIPGDRARSKYRRR